MTENTARRGAPRRRRRPRRKPGDDQAGHVNRSNLTTVNTLPPVESPTGFAALGVPPRIDDGLAACGFAQPFNIQTEAIPVAMTGKDVCGRAKTGSGKTLAFGVPMLARITDEAEPSRPLGLVLVPTRELAVQVAEVLQPVAREAGMTVLPVYGGASRHHQIDELAKGVELVVATPLRLIDLLKSGEVDGISFAPTLLNSGKQKQHEYMYWCYNRHRAVRSGKWKLYRQYDDFNDTKQFKQILCDVSEDPGEAKDLAAENPDRLRSLEGVLTEFEPWKK